MQEAILLALLALAAAADPPPPEADLVTVAEASGYVATATHAEVVGLLERIAARSPVLHLAEMGRSVEDRTIPLAVIADPPVATAAEARDAGKAIVLAFGNIHAGEVCGKEALLMLARELALGPDHPLLENLVVLLVPIYNADGNEDMSPDHRPGQVGPTAGMGLRPNARGLDLNRDWVKLESPEARAMVRLLSEWDPDLTIDTHTTNGSHHRYTLTYAPPLNPSGHAPSIALVRDEILPAVTTRLRDRTGYDTFFYGNFDRDHTTWRTYSADPRFGGPYRGLRGQMSILSEAYAYASYRDRVLVTRAFVGEILTWAAEHARALVEMHERARAETIRAGRNPQPSDVIGLRHRVAALPEPAVIRGYEMEEQASGRPRPTDRPRDEQVVHLGRFEPTVSVRRPYAYLIDPAPEGVIETLAHHGVEIARFDGGPVRVETYRVESITRARREFQGHRMLTLDVRATAATRSFPAGTVLVTTAQPLGTLAVYLLEPQSTDGLAAWNFFDEGLAVGRDFPVYRITAPADLNERRPRE